MPATFRSPISDFRLTAVTTAAQATVTNTAGTETVYVNGTQSFSKIPVVMNASITFACGTNAQTTPLRVNLIDGTSGGTPIRSWGITAPANQSFAISESDLNLKCYTGLATLEFSGTSIALTQQSVALSGYTTSYGEG
jgi:hypothetical protein